MITLLTFVAILLMAAGCDNGGGESAGGHPLPASDFQRAILADGRVEFSEYESAVFAMVDCLRDGGVAVEDPQLEDDGTYSYVTVDPPPDQLAVFERLWAHCNEEYLSVVELGWADELAPPAELEQQFWLAVATCLDAEGVPAEPDPASLNAALNAAPDIYDQCYEEASAGFPELFPARRQQETGG